MDLSLATLLWLLVGVLVVLVLAALLVPRINMPELMELPGVNLLQSMWDLLTHRDEKMYHLLRQYSARAQHTLFCFWFSPTTPMVGVAHPAAAKDILMNNDNITKSDLYTFMHPWLGTGLLTSTHQKWDYRRTLLTPAFHTDALMEHYVEVFNRNAQKLVRKWGRHADEGDHFDPFPAITHMALDAINMCAMGVELNSLDATEGENNEYVEAIYAASNLLWGRMTSPHMWIDWLWKSSAKGKQFQAAVDRMNGFTTSVIAKKRKEHEENGPPDDHEASFLDILLQAETQSGERLSDADLLEEVETFMFEGHDTTSSGMLWTLWLMGQDPEVVAKAQQEVDAVFGSSETLDMEQIKEFEYLDMCIKEGLRMYPPVPNIARRVETRMTILGVSIPVGANVAVNPSLIHYNPDVWDEPQKFNPDRFSRENSKGRDPFAFVPFSAGKRNCIGRMFALREMKVFLAHVLRNYTPSTPPMGDPKPLLELIMRPKDPVYISLARREGASSSSSK